MFHLASYLIQDGGATFHSRITDSVGLWRAVNYFKFARCDDPPSHQAIRKVVVKVFVKSDLGKGHLTRVPKTSQCSFLEGKSPAISQKSRLVKYDSIGPDLIMTELIRNII